MSLEVLDRILSPGWPSNSQLNLCKLGANVFFIINDIMTYPDRKLRQSPDTTFCHIAQLGVFEPLALRHPQGFRVFVLSTNTLKLMRGSPLGEPDASRSHEMKGELMFPK